MSKRTHTPLPEPRLFRPAMDWFVLVMVVLFLVGLFGMIVTILWFSLASTTYKTVAVVVLSASIIYLIDVFFYSNYILDTENLVIEGYLRRIAIPYRSMRELKNGGFLALLSVNRHKRFALSRRNLVLKLQQGPWASISLSPKQREQFVVSLLQRIDQERAHRAVRIHHSKK